ncbi:uncharacterized protein [Dysidea avara]|uniref:uncharacterized protein isoform X1 n=2 Tax=Dysidea avara TaxID=196820 RepID=UPI003329EC2E
MLKLSVAVISLACLVAANSNNAPTFNASKTVWDCTLETVGDKPCEIALVVEPFMSMTYYDIIDGDRKLVGYRARYDEDGNLVLVSTTRRPTNEDRLHPPITVDGEFRPLITVNGQMPGPTIIARENQTLHITVYNELPNVEGISIHWHGMHQRGTSAMDGVAFISQKPIPTHQSFIYKFKAFPNGTHWYHAHSGAHRTDGLYGALIVKDDKLDFLIVDRPEEYTLLLMDWQKDPSIDLFYQIRNSLGFYDDDYTAFDDTKALDNTQVAPIPFWSGIINNKGRHYNKDGQHNFAALNKFSVAHGEHYRFRLIGAQALYAYKFSIENHVLTVVATDGHYINRITDVHYVIVNTGERYDVIVSADQEIRDYWILAETIEDPELGDPNFNNRIMNHKAEAILHYEDATQRFSNSDVSRTWSCLSQTCHYVNCPYMPQENSSFTCQNVEKFRDAFNTAINNPKFEKNLTTFFYDFGFDGETSTSGSSVDGINFRFPSDLPSTNAFRADVCPGRGCDNSTAHHCACTHVIDISNVKQGDALDLVITNSPGTKPPNNPESSHPVHLHGHSFYVVKIGYPEYYSNGTYQSPNQDIECIVEETGEEECEQFITVEKEVNGRFIRNQTVRWRNDTPPEEVLRRDVSFPLKDTVIVPYGGYTVIRFIADNPGWWLLHCHIEIHQLEGMAAVVRESGQGSSWTRPQAWPVVMMATLLSIIILMG